MDPNGAAVAAATVKVAGDRGERSVLTDEQGRFVLAFLAPGAYKVTVSAEGFTPFTEDGVRVGLGQRTIRHYKLAPAVEEAVSVTAQRSVPIDVSVQSTGMNIPSELAESIPLGRNLSNLIYLTPGVKSSIGAGVANPSVHGSSGLENNYVFDGINVTNAGFGALGAYSQVHGSQGTGINFNFIQETQVITGGYSPEYGQATGGIVNVVTKSGTNEWEGSVFGYMTPTGLQGEIETAELVATPRATTLGRERIDYGADIGGPIVRDHVFFWLGINPVQVKTERRADPAFGLFDEGPLTRDEDTLNWAAKFTFQPAPNHRIDLSGFGDPTETNFTFNRATDDDRDTALRADGFDRFSITEYGYENFALKYQGTVTPRFLIDTTLATAENTFEETFPEEFDTNALSDIRNTQVADGDCIDLDGDTTPDPCGRLRRTGGLGFFEPSAVSENDQFEIKFTNLIGSHELKYGYRVEDITFTASHDRTGPTRIAAGPDRMLGTADDVMTTSGASVQRRLDDATGNMNGMADSGDRTIYRVTRQFTSPLDVVTTTDYRAAFIKDDWSITPNLHLDFGVRWEKEDLIGRDTGYDLPHEWSPRVGMSWDHTKRGESKLYGHWGKFFEKVPLDIAVRLFSLESTIVRGDYYDEALSMPVPGTNRYQLSGGGTTQVLPGTRNAYTEEFVLGYQRDLPKNWTIKGEFLHRELGRVLEDFQATAISDIYLHGAGESEFFVSNQPPKDFVPSTGVFREPKRDYNAFTVEATRRADEHWYLTTQYTLSRIEGNYEGLYRNDNGQDDPNLTSLFDFPDDGTLGFQLKNGVLNTDRTHRMQVFGFYQWDNGWSIGSRFQAQGGRPRLRLASHPEYANQGEIPLDRRGRRGRTVTEWLLDVNFAKKWMLSTKFESSISIEVEIFNILNHRFATNYDFFSDTAVGEFNDPGCPVSGQDPGTMACNDAGEEQARFDALVDFLDDGAPNPDFDKPIAYNDPREVRIGFKWKF